MRRFLNDLHADAAHKPENLWLIEGTTRWSGPDLLARVAQCADALVQQGLQPGERVAVLLGNQTEFVVSLLAIWHIGAVAVPLNPQFPPEDLRFVLHDAEARLLITLARFAPMLDGLPIPCWWVGDDFDGTGTSGEKSFEAVVSAGSRDFESTVSPDPNALTLLMYTSGTTGRSKGVMLSENNLRANMSGFAEAIAFTAEDRLLMALPLFHSYGLIIALHALGQGIPMVLVPGFQPKTMLAALAQERITVMPLVPTMYRVLVDGLAKQGTEAFSTLRLCISGGASLPASLLGTLEKTAGITIMEGYGLTEASPVVSVNRPERGSVPGAVGPPLSNVSVRLTDAADRLIACPVGEPSLPGEIWVKGPSVMLGYHNLPTETAEAITPEGWLRTGDIGHFDAAGNLVISGGRKKDLMIKAGENIAPARIEQVLHQHPDIAEACVFGVPHDKLGEDIFAAIVLKESCVGGLSSSELKRFCQEQLTPLMIPTYFKMYAMFPKTATGKVQKKQLQRENWTAAQPVR